MILDAPSITDDTALNSRADVPLVAGRLQYFRLSSVAQAQLAHDVMSTLFGSFGTLCVITHAWFENCLFDLTVLGSHLRCLTHLRLTSPYGTYDARHVKVIGEAYPLLECLHISLRSSETVAVLLGCCSLTKLHSLTTDEHLIVVGDDRLKKENGALPFISYDNHVLWVSVGCCSGGFGVGLIRVCGIVETTSACVAAFDDRPYCNLGTRA